MKPPPGPMIHLPPTTRRAARPARHPAPVHRASGAAVPRPATPLQRRGTALAALALAIGVFIGGVAALAPYADGTGLAGPSSSIDGR